MSVRVHPARTMAHVSTKLTVTNAVVETVGRAHIARKVTFIFLILNPQQEVIYIYITISLSGSERIKQYSHTFPLFTLCFK